MAGEGRPVGGSRCGYATPLSRTLGVGGETPWGGHVDMEPRDIAK